MPAPHPTVPVVATPPAAAGSGLGVRASAPVQRASPPSGPQPRPAPAALRVSATSRPTLVAGAIAGMIREHGRAEVQAIGAGAINQAVKAVAISRSYLQPAGMNIVCVPEFVEVLVDSAERTAIRFIVEPR